MAQLGQPIRLSASTPNRLVYTCTMIAHYIVPTIIGLALVAAVCLIFVLKSLKITHPNIAHWISSGICISIIIVISVTAIICYYKCAKKTAKPVQT